MNTYHYTYLITNLSPLAEERYYIGVHSSNEKPHKDGYMGSSKYLRSAICKQGIEQFEKIIIQEWDSRDAAEEHENQLHCEHNASVNPLFYNKKNGVVGFHVTPETTKRAGKKRANTVASEDWKHTQERITRNYCKTVNDPQWVKTTGKKKSAKISSFRLSEPGKQANTIHSKTINDPAWKETIGAESTRKRLETIQTKEWKETIGAKMKRKRAKTIKDPEWIARNTHTCPHCGKSMVGVHNYRRWHGSNCKKFFESEDQN